MRGVDPNDRFTGDFDRLFSTIVPLLPLRSETEFMPLERLTVVLLAAVMFSELFVRPFSNAIPPLPLKEMDVRLLAKIAADSRISGSSISRLISFPEA